jgi:hypothetical protein
LGGKGFCSAALVYSARRRVCGLISAAIEILSRGSSEIRILVRVGHM